MHKNSLGKQNKNLEENNTPPKKSTQYCLSVLTKKI